MPRILAASVILTAACFALAVARPEKEVRILGSWQQTYTCPDAPTLDALKDCIREGKGAKAQKVFRTDPLNREQIAAILRDAAPDPALASREIQVSPDGFLTCIAYNGGLPAGGCHGNCGNAGPAPDAQCCWICLDWCQQPFLGACPPPPGETGQQQCVKSKFRNICTK